ncbi:MAG: MBOAT family protein, partial [Clostridiales bacterium]|nr:MBOAT family protein [Clostridiales bacterium]
MSFVSGQFLLFVAVVVVLFYVVPQKYKWVLLLVASYSFYLFGGVKPVIFILLSTFSTFGAGLMMGRYEKKQKKEKRRILILLLLLNFGILLLLKYYNFFAENIDPLFRTFEYDISMPLVNIMLPLGISFYTFQAMGYAIDIYRGKYEPETNLAHFALFVSFFPQIMQGPISRYNQL